MVAWGRGEGQDGPNPKEVTQRSFPTGGAVLHLDRGGGGGAGYPCVTASCVDNSPQVHVQTDENTVRSCGLVKSLYQGQFPDFDFVLQLCKMSPLGEAGGRAHRTLCIIFTTSHFKIKSFKKKFREVMDVPRATQQIEKEARVNTEVS